VRPSFVDDPELVDEMQDVFKLESNLLLVNLGGISQLL